MKLSAALLPALALGLALPSLARADVPPEPGYVETCTVENQQGAGEECLVCGDAYHGDVDACKKHEATGHSRRCKTRGASVWSEVWCKPGAKQDAATTPPTEIKSDKPPAPAPASAGGGKCSVVADAGGGWLLVVLGLALARRRRR